MRIGMMVMVGLLAGCTPGPDRDADLARMLEICVQQRLPASQQPPLSAQQQEVLIKEHAELVARFADEDERAWLETQHRDNELEQQCLEEALDQLER